MTNTDSWGTVTIHIHTGTHTSAEKLLAEAHQRIANGDYELVAHSMKGRMHRDIGRKDQT